MIPHNDEPEKLKFQISNRLLSDGETIRLSIRDGNSRIQFLEIDMKAFAFLEMMRGRADADAEGTIISLDKVGKKHEHHKLEFPLPIGYSYSRDTTNLLIEESKKYLTEGWVSDDAYNSQDSFFTKEDGTKWARVIIRRWT